MIKQVIIDGSVINDIPSFYDEINRVFMADEDWKIGHSLDAFNDVLFGGYGLLHGNEAIRLLWHHIAHSREALGREATKSYYQEKLKPDSPFNKALFKEKLAALENGTGQTYFDIVMEIIADHPNVEVIGLQE